jgi:amidase
MDRRNFLLGAASATLLGTVRTANAHPAQAAQSGNNDFELHEVTISDLGARMSNGEFTSEKITQLYLNRIESVDRNGPTIRAVIETNPDALSIARDLDRERKAKGPRGPLHGVPILIKDNIDTADKMQTTAGSLALVGSPVARDAFVAERLRLAGAVLLGKTNLSEWANFRSTHSTSGWSGRGGLTRNPYALDRNPCGSSSGSGAAVSSNLSAAAVGTETDGSVVCPSSMCGIVGIKPTLGLISRSGIIPIAHSQDTAGPMTRTVRDAAMLLSVLAAADSRDPATAELSGKISVDYTKFLDVNGLKGKRIGIARQYFNISPSVTRLMESCISDMKGAGAEIVDPVEFEKFEQWRDTETAVLLYEFKADLKSYLSARGAKVRSLADCIAFNNEHRAEEMPYFEQELMEQAQAKGDLSSKEYRDALAANLRFTRKDGIDALFKKHKLDAICGPTSGPSWMTDLVAGDHADSGCASPPAVAGYPHITVPAGFVFGLPVGISFFGQAWTEPALLPIAYSFEQIRKARRAPSFLPTANLSS